MSKAFLVWVTNDLAKHTLNPQLCYGTVPGDTAKRAVKTHELTPSEMADCQMAVRARAELRKTQLAAPAFNHGAVAPELTPLGYFSEKYPKPLVISEITDKPR